MNTLKKVFPYSFKTGDLKTLIVKIVVYIVASFVLGLVLGLLGGIPLLGIVFRVVSWVVSVYCLVGIVLAILDFLKILK